ncbi:hypothetical protein G6O69_34170 [Pseudenhygromyxa sp. WMMC2535]|uniref:hypothetical protein n=1 Tax=Pseudenhygromyxa sp. WMMC2535 TaxID=2712867 RepID=UPI0015575C66|nr:hypothetical protein [Pseudenhygromyxa sp. WMMC2535]NVB42918.1 hypothetical protein [Pseudenhygromyxa sp. WMMC2535]
MLRQLRPTCVLVAVASFALACSDDVVADAGSELSGSDEVGPGTDSSGEGTPGSTDTSTETSTDTDTGTSAETDTETSAGTETETDTGELGPTVDLGVLAILDVNPTSATFEQTRHPDDYPDQISAWYFGHAT